MNCEDILWMKWLLDWKHNVIVEGVAFWSHHLTIITDHLHATHKNACLFWNTDIPDLKEILLNMLSEMI